MSNRPVSDYFLGIGSEGNEINELLYYSHSSSRQSPLLWIMPMNRSGQEWYFSITQPCHLDEADIEFTITKFIQG